MRFISIFHATNYGIWYLIGSQTNLNAGAPEPSSTPHRLFQILDLLNFGGVDLHSLATTPATLNKRERTNPLQHKLCNTVSFLDFKIGIRVVEKQHFHLATVVGINDARTYINI
jgi:hypothetical protein